MISQNADFYTTGGHLGFSGHFELYDCNFMREHLLMYNGCPYAILCWMDIRISSCVQIMVKNDLWPLPVGFILQDLKELSLTLKYIFVAIRLSRSFRCIFIWSSCMFVGFFVKFRLTTSEQQAKTWVWIQNKKWPLTSNDRG